MYSCKKKAIRGCIFNKKITLKMNKYHNTFQLPTLPFWVFRYVLLTWHFRFVVFQITSSALLKGIWVEKSLAISNKHTGE